MRYRYLHTTGSIIFIEDVCDTPPHVLSKTLNCLPCPEQDRKLFTESAGPRAKGVAPLLDAELSLFPM